jgi:hypothetical protein
MTRDKVFVSHANPEDNEFARWVALQLASGGYSVWSDLTKLLGGETFWDDIQEAIKERTAKFLFVLSRSSNAKEGALQELDCAKGVAKKQKATLRDFIIPLKIDDLPYDDVHIIVRRLNQISFRPSWAKGLAQLLEKLEKDGVPKNVNFTPAAVGTWWRTQFSAEQGVINEPEEYLSNWFPISGLPEKLFCYHITRDEIGKVEVNADLLPFPAINDSDISILSFAKAEDFNGKLGEHLHIADSREFLVSEILAGKGPKGFARHLSQILRMAWERMMLNRLFPAHEMASKAKCFYFQSGMVQDDTLYFAGVAGKRAHRGIIGFKTTPGGKRYWHFGIQGKPVLRPEPMVVIKGHVVFSDDGKTLWTSADRLHRARRSQCRNWWNDEWRDRILATMTHLTGEQGEIMVSLGSDVSFRIEPTPLLFMSPVSYSVSEEPTLLDDDLVRDFDFENGDEDLEEVEAAETTVTPEEE